MAFIKELKKELTSKIGKSRCCQLAELSALLSVNYNENGFDFTYENEALAKKVCALIYDLFNCSCEIIEKKRGKTKEFCVSFPDETILEKLAIILKFSGNDGVSLKERCCKRAFVRGVFIICGTISNPESAYNLEFIFKDKNFAEEFQKILESVEIFARMIVRKKYYVLYLKDAEQISRLLSLCSSHKSLLDFEELRVLKDYRNKLNRQVNCETANSNKAVLASVKQVEDIEFIRDNVGIDYLDERLAALARLRLEEPYANMTQLADMLDEPLSKSGVNHRFKKIKEIAENIRKNKKI